LGKKGDRALKFRMGEGRSLNMIALFVSVGYDSAAEIIAPMGGKSFILLDRHYD